MSLASRVLPLTVPEVEEEDANGAPLRRLLPHASRDRVAKNDSQWEVRLGKLHHGETGEADKGSRLQQDGPVVGISVLLPGRRGIRYDWQVVSVDVTVQFLQVLGLSDI